MLGGILMLARPPAIAPLGELGVLFCVGIPPVTDPIGPVLEFVGDSPCRRP